jgi:mono/diheme cytochrome c family protein
MLFYACFVADAAHLAPFFWREVTLQMFKLISLFAAVALVVSTTICYSADAEHGHDLAKRWCASCHLVSADQQRGNADAPPFATIARSPSFDAKRLSYFLLDPHPKMPELPLSRAAADDVAAYIDTLKK